MLRNWIVGLAVSAAFVLAGCGGSSGNQGTNGGTGNGGGSSNLTAEVSHAKVATGSGAYVASAQIRVGGVAGKHLTLEWGLVDALQGNQSQEERVLHRYVTTKTVITDEQSVSIPISQANSPLLVHFVLYAPNGTYLSSSDTPDFGKGS
jgi:hypothetical protein